jgi:endonuclease/exonuclease/phosphatase family metal-dependent hydrolase
MLFSGIKNLKEFMALNLHFDHIGNVARVKSSELILKKIKEINPKNLPVTVSGDFNLTEDSEPIKIMSQNMKDSFIIQKQNITVRKGLLQVSM